MCILPRKRVPWVGTCQRIVQGEACQVALHIDPRVGQLLAVNPDSPLGVPKEDEHQNIELRLWQTSEGAHRKIAPVSFFGVFLSANARVLFRGPFTPIAGAGLKVPAPEPPETNWDGLGWAK